MTDKDRPRLYVTFGLFILFGYVLWRNADNQMLIGAIIGSFGTAITFWLGSSKGSADKSDQLERTATEAKDEREATPDTPQDVTVINPPSEPVPTTQTRKP